MMSRKGTRGALAMHQQAPWLAVHHVLFLLGDVVRNLRLAGFQGKLPEKGGGLAALSG